MVSYLNYKKHMASAMQKVGFYLWRQAMQQNKKNILSMLEKNPKAKLLDLGCQDGVWTIPVAQKINTKNIYGIDIVDPVIDAARKKGIKVKKSDISADKFPFKSNFFDVVHSNQLIEHLANTDHFATEIYRVLKPGGYAIISTENLSAWFNLVSLVLGYRAFSQDVSTSRHVGNPFALHDSKPRTYIEGPNHLRIFTYFSLAQFFEMHKFKVESIESSGYYPFPYPLERLFAKIDPIHGHFITVKIRKKK